MIRVIGSFANGFILFSRTDDGNGPSIYIADQHAVHERIRLEMLMRHIEQRRTEIGTSLFPFSMTKLDRNLLNYDATKLDLVKSRACQGIAQTPLQPLILPNVGAIKITDCLNPSQAAELLKGLFSTCRFPYICAHGRPTLIRLTIE